MDNEENLNEKWIESSKIYCFPGSLVLMGSTHVASSPCYRFASQGIATSILARLGLFCWLEVEELQTSPCTAPVRVEPNMITTSNTRAICSEGMDGGVVPSSKRRLFILLNQDRAEVVANYWFVVCSGLGTNATAFSIECTLFGECKMEYELGTIIWISSQLWENESLRHQSIQTS